MSNLKKHFFHISKSWFSVCTFIITMHFDNVPIWADQEMYLLM